MFSKVLVAVAFVLGLTVQANAHAVIIPVLGVAGTAVRADVQRPTTAAPCGTTNIAANLNNSTSVAVGASGVFSVTVQNFNGGQDGSRQVTANVDTTAVGKTFVAATVTQNGDLAPTNVGTQVVTVQLPSGIKCTGGTSKNLCLMSFKTAGNFGNCVVVKQTAATKRDVGAVGSRAARALKDADESM
ncbi:hypothetical protein NLI96_g4853 [Meripilus lineatus]|uniref:GEgh 16 protein n=1 Tax=Meripilus lineatus TaxID=2056292 RepID=A0AAD5V9F0_9APHY|nr:hypothetical protein NLI96_g4853 [Physisporinus lineatus]